MSSLKMSMSSKATMRIEVYGQPQGKQRARVCMRGNYARAYTPEKTASYENLINLSYIQALKGAPSPFWDKPIKITIQAIYQIPKSFSRKRTAAALDGQIRPQVKPDIDNVVKVVCDALNKVAYKDDTQVVEIAAYKRYGAEPMLQIDIDEVQASCDNDTL
ncbi:MAG: RusA family crossover junction endodeoxyribonuclease [Ruminococcus flavefaciens]|nr:RusA family crossover junction endodeoxyribonuclease [Ruminococcus flavefaciens]